MMMMMMISGFVERIINNPYTAFVKRFDNQLDNRLYRVYKHPTGCQTDLTTANGVLEALSISQTRELSAVVVERMLEGKELRFAERLASCFE